MWKEKALQHAIEQDTKESVGLLVNIKGKKSYLACKNLAGNAEQCFILDPKDYVKAEELGQVVAVIHSHPSGPPTPSESDKISCEAGDLPWHIVSPITKEWDYYEPVGYKAPLKGRTWHWGVTDCYTLVQDWYREVRGIELIDGDRPLSPEAFLENPVYDGNKTGDDFLKSAGFRPLSSEERLENGDVLLMNRCSKGLNHVAIFLNGEVLHHLSRRLSCQEPYSEWLLKCTGGRYRYAQDN